MQQWSVPAWLVITVLALAFVGLLVLGALVVALARTRARLAETAALAERVEDVERQLAETRDAKVHEPELEGPQPGTQPSPDEAQYVITQVGESEAATGPAPTVPAPLFADLVLRESLVQVVSYAAGVRRALSAENRNRIRFEMRREVKRARKQRRTDLKQAKRDWEARQREALDEDDAA